MTSLTQIEKRIQLLLDHFNERLFFNQDEILEKRERYKSFHAFIQDAWPSSGSNQYFIDGLPVQAVAEHLEAVYYRQIRNLILNLPIRCGKSHLLSVLFPAWVWTRNPPEQFLYASYAERVIVRDQTFCRRLIGSPWYQSIWGDYISITSDVDNKERFENTYGGCRMAITLKGANLGSGADFIIADDPNSLEDVLSPREREKTLMFWEMGLYGRQNNPDTVCRIVSQQRLHEEDLTGCILESEFKDMWTVVRLPMRFEEKHRCITYFNGKIWEDPRQKEGELLWPERYDEEEVRELEKGLRTPLAINSQLQLRPNPEGGYLFKRENFQLWEADEPPDIDFIIQSWDTAITTGKTSCNSAITTWGVFKDSYQVNNLLLLSAWEGKVEMPDLKRVAINFFRDYNYDPIEPFTLLEKTYGSPDIIMVEKAANGTSLIQELRRAGLPVIGFEPKLYGSKFMRAQIAASLIESERIFVPAKGPTYRHPRNFAEKVISAAVSYPNGRYVDFVDSMSQALIKARKDGWIFHQDDFFEEEYYDKREKRTLY